MSPRRYDKDGAGTCFGSNARLRIEPDGTDQRA